MVVSSIISMQAGSWGRFLVLAVEMYPQTGPSYILKEINRSIHQWDTSLNI